MIWLLSRAIDIYLRTFLFIVLGTALLVMLAVKWLGIGIISTVQFLIERKQDYGRREEARREEEYKAFAGH